MRHVQGPTERLTFDAARLMAEHPPKLRHPNKQAVFEIAYPEDRPAKGKVVYSRWSAIEPPGTIDLGAGRRMLVVREDYFDYVPLLDEPGAVEWHVNFADTHLFGYYAGRHFAQDEVQVAEHPVLASVREALLWAGRPALTIERGRPTPVLVVGAERRCRVATDPDPTAGRPDGLYGRRFGAAAIDAVRAATVAIAPPTRTNLIAIAAPSGGHGPYLRDDISSILLTAYAGFRAAVIESGRIGVPGGKVVVHSGYWGGGAFGGSRTLISILQIAAAAAAGLDAFVFHTGTWGGGAAPLTAAMDVLDGLETVDAERWIDQLVLRRYTWGHGDGN